MGERVSDGRTTVERTSDRELVATRVFDGPVRIVYDAWTKAELFQLWWAPKSSGVPMIACEMDVRTGGGYRVEFQRDAENTMAFFGKYLEVVPQSRLVWTNDEGEEGAITTVTFEEKEGGKTLLVLSELYPSKEALDESFVGMEDAMPEQFGQLDDVLVGLNA
jgi:uncharacterized protein YndB with AHSA1/START domain